MNLNEPELCLVMPVYNEQSSLQKVVPEWVQELEKGNVNFIFLAINDGSQDGSLNELKKLQSQLGSRMEIITRENRGHGQSCLQGYRVAIQRGIPWVLQIDSDGQCDPKYFMRMWQMRHDFDVIYGHRLSRDDGWSRVMGSLMLRLAVLLTSGVNCVDANVPYRLMRTEVLRDLVDRLPPHFVLANVGLSVLLRRRTGVREGRTSIRFRKRYGGAPSLSLSKFGSKATELVRQLRQL